MIFAGFPPRYDRPRAKTQTDWRPHHPGLADYNAGQSVGLPYLIPAADAKLGSEPLAEGDLYPGDLLQNVLKIDDGFWRSHHDLLSRMLPVATSARDTTDDDEIRNKCTAFVSQWIP